jgi:hypothetical protein
MDKNDVSFWSNLTFTTECRRKILDFGIDDENIITPFEGNISILRLSESKPPYIIGDYAFEVWNIETAKLLNIDILKLANDMSCIGTYKEFINLIENKLINVFNYKRIIFIHSLIIHENYRKQGITEEFIEYIYRDYDSKENLILAFVKPIQANSFYNELCDEKTVQVIDRTDDKYVYDNVVASDYYSLNNVQKKEDNEINEYKLFALVQRCDFERIGESYLFKFTPNKTIKRLKEKIKLFKLLYR